MAADPNTRSHSWAEERTWKCKVCGTEVAAVYFMSGEPEIIVYRYIDLGSMQGHYDGQWKKVAEPKPREARSRLDRKIQEVGTVYGPLMRFWTEKLGVIYHYDTDVAPWLSLKVKKSYYRADLIT
jgi:hypothetical protein